MTKLDRILTEIGDAFCSMLKWALIVGGILVILAQINIAVSNALINWFVK